MFAPVESERRNVGSRALVLFSAVLALSGLIAWGVYEHASAFIPAPGLALYVPSSGLQPVAVPGLRTEPVPVASPSKLSPGAQMPADPAAPVAQPYVMMPLLVDSPGGPMPTGQPFMQAVPPAVETIEKNALMDPLLQMLFWGSAASVAIGAAIMRKQIYDQLQNTANIVGSLLMAEYNLELGMLPRPANAFQPAAATRELRAGVPNMMELSSAGVQPTAEKTKEACRHQAPLMQAGPFSETPVRSFVKAAGWRFTAGVVTAITSMIYTGSLETAAAIVGWDLISKSITMFLGERLWNNVQWGREETGDSAKRSLAKAIAWRIFAACNTFFAAIVLNKGKEGAMGVAGKIAGTDSVFKTVLFYFYERVWAIVSWGKEFEKAPKAEEA